MTRCRIDPTLVLAWQMARLVPNGYRMELHQAGSVTRACIIAPAGDLAASGCAAETADVFIFDRIETAHSGRLAADV